MRPLLPTFAPASMTLPGVFSFERFKACALPMTAALLVAVLSVAAVPEARAQSDQTLSKCTFNASETRAGRWLGNNGCTLTYRIANIPEGFSDVVIFGTNGVHLKKENTTVLGDVVVNEPGFEIKVEKGNTVNGDLKADRIKIEKDAVIDGDVFFNELDNKGTISGAENTPLTLPVFTAPPAFQTANPRADAPDVSVGAGQTTVLAAGEYGDITVAETGTVVFSGGLYDVRSLISGAASTIHFGAPTDLRILERLDVGENSVVGPEPGSGIIASHIILYVAGADGPAGDAARIGKESEVSANLYAGNGTLSLKQDLDATGAFLGVNVIVDKNSTVELDSHFTNRPPVADPQDVFTDGANDLEIILTGSDPEGGSLAFSTSSLAFPSRGTLSAPVLIIPDPIDRCSESGTSCMVDTDCPGTETCEAFQPPTTSASVTYTPLIGDNEENSFTFQVTDEAGAMSEEALVQINTPGDPTDVPPVTEVGVEDVEAETLIDTPVTILLAGSAPEGVVLTFSIVGGTGPANGTLSVVNGVPPTSATVAYTPNGGFEGTDSFDFMACGEVNGEEECDTATATITVADPVVEPDPDTVTLEDQAMETGMNQPVAVTLTAETSTTGESLFRTFTDASGKTHAAFLLPADVAGNVADCEPFDVTCTPDGFGDNHNNLPGPVPIFMSAGVDLSGAGGDGSRGVKRMQFEWDISSLQGFATEVQSAEVILHTHKGSVDTLDTDFFAGAAEQDGLLTDDDFEAPVDASTVLATMPVPDVPTGTDSTFVFDVLEQVLQALAADQDFFSIQGRVDESESGQRGLEVRTTADGNVNGTAPGCPAPSCEPMLAITTPGVIAQPIFAVLLEVVTLPLSGELIDHNGRPIGAMPFPNGATFVYTPSTGFIGEVSFQVEAQLVKILAGDSTIISTSLATVTLTVGTTAASERLAMQNHPNPFNPTTTISFTVPAASHVTLAIYDVLGRKVRVLADGAHEAGTHEAVFEARDLPSGMYFYRLETDTGIVTKSMLLLK